MKKLTRKQIVEGFESIPIDTLLLGVSSTSKTKLTHKQREFAREVAMGETKAGAYRKAYKSKAKPKVASQNGRTLVKNSAIQVQIDAFKVAIEAQKYTTPAHLRALAIHKITEKALDPNCPPAQQLKALELLGKITEVSLFTHRIETVKTVSSSDMRDKLMESIKMAISNSQAIDVEAHNADDLLAEIARGKDYVDDVVYSELANHDDVVIEDDVVIKENITSSDKDLLEVVEGFVSGDSSTLHTPDPQFSALPTSPDLHSIPNIQSPVKSCLTPVRDEISSESITCESSNKNPNTRTPPVNVSNTKGGGV
jgi:hypothetical protein